MLAPEEIADGGQMTALSPIRPTVNIVDFSYLPLSLRGQRLRLTASCAFESKLAPSHPQTGRKILRNTNADTKYNLTGCTR